VGETQLASTVIIAVSFTAVATATVPTAAVVAIVMAGEVRDEEEQYKVFRKVSATSGCRFFFICMICK